MCFFMLISGLAIAVWVFCSLVVVLWILGQCGSCLVLGRDCFSKLVNDRKEMRWEGW